MATTSRTRVVKNVALACAVLAACLLPWLVEPLTLGRLGAVMYLGVGVLSLNLLVGMNGQIALGQATFLGIGAYTVVVLTSDYGWPLWGATMAAVVVSAAAGTIVGLPALRLRGFYMALTTLGIALVFPTLLQAGASLTGGTSGKSLAAPVLAPAWTGLDPTKWLYLVLLALTLVSLVLIRNLRDGRIGRAMAASRDHDVVAESFGVSLPFIKLCTFSVSSGLAGLAGAMFAMQRQFVSPADFGLLRSIDLFTGMAIGGPTSIIGAILGGGFLEYVPTTVESLGLRAELTPFVYGLVLVLLTLFMRDGLTGGAVRLWGRVHTLLRPKPGSKSAKPHATRQSTAVEGDLP